MSRKVSFKYEHFEKLWKKASEEQKAKIFYYSLFDFGSFEQESRKEVFNFVRLQEKNLKQLLRLINKNVFAKIEREGFVRSVSSDKFLRYLLFYELKKAGVHISYKKNDFPDLKIREGVDLEIKRLSTTKSFQDYLEDLENKRCDKLFLLLLFPQISGEDVERVQELTKGYYFIKKRMINKNYFDMLISYPTPDNFNEIMKKIIKCVRNPRWCKMNKIKELKKDKKGLNKWNSRLNHKEEVIEYVK